MNREAERAVIGCLLLDNRAIEDIYELLTPEMFGDSIFGRLYYEFKCGYDNDYIVDVPVLQSKLEGSDIDKVVFNETMMEILEPGYIAFEIKKYAELISADYVTRRTQKILNDTKLTSDEIGEQIQELVAELENVNSKKTSNTQTIVEIVDEVAKTKFNDLRPDGITFGIDEFDEYVDLDGGDICIIAARPSVGKSAIAKQIAFNLAKKGLKVELFVLEMTKEQIYDRIVSTESGIELKRLRRGKSFVGNEKEKFERANNVLRKLGDRLIINDDIFKISEMKADMKRNHVDIGIIDYAQLIKPETHYKGNRYAEVGAISHSVKETAKSLNIPIVLLAQLNRVSEKTQTKEPTSSELRESGDFEQDASAIILMWNKNEERTLKGVKVDKNRNYKIGSFELEFDGKTMTFTSVNQYARKTPPKPPEKLEPEPQQEVVLGFNDDDFMELDINMEVPFT